MLVELPRLPLTSLPTPLQEARRLSDMLGGPRIFLKRDDLTGIGLGGNKVRKLEYLLADALAQGADTIITTGAAQSNHARQTAAAAAHAGLHCVLILNEPYFAKEYPQGNVLLNHLFGAEMRYIPANATLDEQNCAMEEAAQELRAVGRHPYIVAMGGSSAVGAAGYINAALELDRQFREFHIQPRVLYVSSGSGGTQSGLLIGRALLQASWSIIGVSPNKNTAIVTERVWNGIQAARDLLGIPEVVSREDIHIRDEYVGGGYGVPTRGGVEAIRLLARSEGVVLDPVYTAKAMDCMIDDIRRGAYHRDDVVIFLVTGGTPALFALGREVLELVPQE